MGDFCLSRTRTENRDRRKMSQSPVVWFGPFAVDLCAVSLILDFPSPPQL